MTQTSTWKKNTIKLHLERKLEAPAETVLLENTLLKIFD
jgi:hypothetical protein